MSATLHEQIAKMREIIETQREEIRQLKERDRMFDYIDWLGPAENVLFRALTKRGFLTHEMLIEILEDHAEGKSRQIDGPRETVRVHMMKIRRKLKEKRAKVGIANVFGVGYKLTGNAKDAARLWAKY